MLRNKTLFVFLILAVIAWQCTNKKPHNSSDILSPAEAIANFNIENGFEVQTVAAEPTVEDPVALQFDADGNMWVVEMRGYMHDKEGAGENLPLGRIKVLEDRNDDGLYETAHIFLDSLVMPRAATPVTGGILVIEPPKLYFVENKNGKAGAKLLIDSAFAEGGNAEHQPNSLFQAMDNWIYAANSNKRLRFINGKWKLEKTQFRGQWGITQDDYGRLFYNDNSTTLMGDNFLPNAFAENDAYQRQSRNSYSMQLVSNRVFPARRTTGINRGYEKGMLDSTGRLVNVTAACGPEIYRGDNFPAKYYGNAFVMEPSAYLMKRIILQHDSDGQVRGSFAYDNNEFLTGTDERFRPVSASTTPDGTLYFIDMHRGVIQHTTYLTPYLRHYIDSLKLERPIGMGRIYRVKWKAHGLSKKLKLSTLSARELVPLLNHSNGWYRDMAQRLLIEKGDKSVVPALEDLARSTTIVPALHALYTLEGLHALTISTLQTVATASNNTVVKTTCMKLLEGFAPDKIALQALAAIAGHNKFTALQYANSLPYFKKAFSKLVQTELLSSWRAHRIDTLFLDALVGSATGSEKQFLTGTSKKDVADSSLRKALQQVIAKRAKARNNPAATLPKAEAELYNAGQHVFQNICATCHGATGDGIPNVAPPLVGSAWVLQKTGETPIRIVLDGLSGPVTVGNHNYAPPEYTGTMPALRNNITINNGDLAAVITYIRNSWGNKAPAVSVAQVAQVRQATAQRQQPYAAVELQVDSTKKNSTATKPRR